MAKDYEIKSGDGLSRLAADEGFAPETLWNDPGNQNLSGLRKNANVLLPGDILHIPDLVPKTITAASEQKHRFQRIGVPAEVEIQLMVEGLPQAQAKYLLYIDGDLVEGGTTDDNGAFLLPVFAGAKEGKVVVGADEHEFLFTFGTLDPETEPTGVQQRLANLKFFEGPCDGAESPSYTTALLGFQQHFDLELSGLADKATVARLVDEHDKVQPGGLRGP